VGGVEELNTGNAASTVRHPSNHQHLPGWKRRRRVRRPCGSQGRHLPNGLCGFRRTAGGLGEQRQARQAATPQCGDRRHMGSPESHRREATDGWSPIPGSKASRRAAASRGQAFLRHSRTLPRMDRIDLWAAAATAGHAASRDVRGRSGA
jgi:hypothetical protein